MLPMCPACQVLIAAEDVNVAQDVALCRACGKIHSFSRLAKRSSPAELEAVDLSRPPPGMRLIQNATEVAVVISTRSLIAAAFLVPFTALWSGGSLTGIYGSQIRSGHFSLAQSLFGLPFLLGTLVLVPATLMCLCGHIKISLRGDEGQVYAGVSFLGYRKKFLASEVTDVYAEATRPDSDGDRSWTVMLERKPKPLMVYSSSSEEKRNFVAAVLRAWLGLAGKNEREKRAA